MTRELCVVMLAYVVIFASYPVIVMSDPCDRCVANADCVNGSCVCTANYTGNPYVHCHLKNNLYCQLLNDPILTTFAYAKIKVHVLGATKLAQLMTTRSDLNQFCDFTLYAIMERIRGKTYPRGFEFTLVYPDVSLPSINVTIVLRLESSRQQDGSIVWQYFRDNQGPNALTHAVTIPFNLCTHVLRVTPSRLVIAAIGCCGIKLGIRPYTGDFLYPPGLFVEIDANNQPTFNNWEPSLEPLCLDQGSFTISDLQNVTGISGPVEAMTYLAHTNMLGWNYLNVIYQEFNLLANMRTCPADRRTTFLNCVWFAFTNAHFMNCVSHNTKNNYLLYSFITLKLGYLCHDIVPACEAARQLLESSCSIIRYPFIQEFVNLTCT